MDFAEPRRKRTRRKGRLMPRRMDRESSVVYMDCLFSVLAGSDETGGRFGLMEMIAPKGREPSRHLHRNDDEGFYVIEGEVTFYVGGGDLRGPAPARSSSCRMAWPTPYTFETEAVRMLSIVAPGGLEAHFRDARFAEPARDLTLPTPSGGPDAAVVEEMGEDLAGYGTEVVGLPDHLGKSKGALDSSALWAEDVRHEGGRTAGRANEARRAQGPGRHGLRGLARRHGPVRGRLRR